MEETTNEKATREQNTKFSEWRVKVSDELPALAQRVFSLRAKMYTGCGFHWAMERDLGYVMAKVNDFDDSDIYYGSDAAAKQIALEVTYELLRENVQKAEESAKELERENASDTV